MKKNIYSILGILSPFFGWVVGMGTFNTIKDSLRTLMAFMILGICFSVISLLKKESKILSFIALTINIAPIVYLIFILAPSLRGFGVLGRG